MTRPKDPKDMSRGELIEEVRRLRHLLSQHMSGGENLWMESGVSDHGNPFIQLHWGKESGQLTPRQARLHGLHIIEVACAAEHDAALVKTFVEQMGIDRERAAVMLGMMRTARGMDAHSSGGGPKSTDEAPAGAGKTT